MIGEKYSYKGEMLRQAEIAKREGISRQTLADWYKKTGDMELAVEGAKKAYAQRNIEYYAEILSLKAISEKEHLKFETLKKNYYDTNNIYEAVKLTKASQFKKHGDILYNGQYYSIAKIAELEDIDRKGLARYYEKTNDIYEAIKLEKAAKEKRHGTIDYHGEKLTIHAIANMEGIKRETLKNYYETYHNIDKAVFITKESQLKRKEALLKGKKRSYESIGRELNMSVIELDKMINSGIDVNNIKRKPKKGITSDEILKYNDENLYKYCLDHSYNYVVINYMVKTLNKTPEEAIKAYLENGQHMPIKWIYEKYGVLFRHLALSFGLDSNRILRLMKENNFTLEEAIERIVFTSNNQNNDFTNIEIDWMEELYQFIKDLSENEYESVKDTFYITEREENFIKEKSIKINNISRQLLLFEFANVLDEWSSEDLNEMMELYNITDDEKKIIVTDLYKKFDDKIINPTEEYNRQQEIIKYMVLNETISNETILNDNLLSDDMKQEILKKRDIFSKISNNYMI